jgi:hypothetical protein
MNTKNKLVAFTVALASTLTLGNAALAGWQSYVDDAVRLLSRPSVRSSGDDAVRLISRPRFDPRNATRVATFAVAGGSGAINYYYLMVNCSTKVAQWGNPQVGYRAVNFNSVQSQCR